MVQLGRDGLANVDHDFDCILILYQRVIVLRYVDF